MNKVYSYPLKALSIIKSLDKSDDEIDDFDKYLNEDEFDQFFWYFNQKIGQHRKYE